jgi:hypothetical protein
MVSEPVLCPSLLQMLCVQGERLNRVRVEKVDEDSEVKDSEVKDSEVKDSEVKGGKWREYGRNMDIIPIGCYPCYTGTIVPPARIF